MPVTKFEKGKVKEKINPKVLGVLSAAFGYKISSVDDLDYEEYHNELREAMIRGKGKLSPAQMAVLSAERTRIRAQKSVYKADFKKTTMTAADIKKGSAIQLAENSALSLYNGGVGKSPAQESSEEILGDIDAKLDELLQTIKADKNLEDEKATTERKTQEDKKRSLREKVLESKGFQALQKTTEKVLKPFRSVWDRIWGFLKTIILGRILFKIIQWMGNKANQSKLKSIFKFLKDWWPTMLAAYLLFGNAFGRMAVSLTVAVGRFTIKLLALIPKLLAAIAKVKLGKILNRIPLGGRFKAGIGLFQMGASAFNEGGVVPGSGNTDTVPAMLTPGEFVMSKGAVEKFGVNTLAGMNAAGGGTNQPEMGLPGLGGGGGGTDALTEQAKVKTFGSAIGDFFSGDDGRSRRMTAQDKWMEMSSGGLVQGFSGGGLVDNGIGSIDWNNRVNREYAKYPDKRLISPATLLKGAEVAVYDEMGKWLADVRGPRLPGTNKERFRAKMDLLQAREKKIQLSKSREKKIELSPDEISEVNKERAIGGQPPFKGGGAIVPLPSSITPVPGPPVQKTNLWSMVSEQQSKDSSSASLDNSTKVPEIDAEAKISQNKIKVLGISI